MVTGGPKSPSTGRLPVSQPALERTQPISHQPARVMAKRIIDAARAGERDMTRLRDVALAALKSAKNRL